MKATVEPIGADVLCRSSGAVVPELRLDGPPLLSALAGWSERYGRAVVDGMDGELLAIGREMFAGLDGNGWASAWLRATGSRAFEVRVDDCHDALARALLDAPWELLASSDGYLADDRVHFSRSSAASAP